MEYEDQLERAMSHTPDIRGTEERFEVASPELRTEGNVTIFENFQTVVDDLGRDATHVLKHLQDEIGTSAQIDESGRARLTGDFRASRIEEILDEYVDAYVRCPECGLPDTRFEREQGVTLLKCDACGALSSTGS